jgi:ribosomal-protein-serine acetyltransferase
MIIDIDAKVRLELTAEKHAKPLFEAVNNNREHLYEFLPWVDSMQSVDDFREYIKNCELLYEQKKEVSFVIILNECAVGRIGLHYLNLQNKNAAIGYWLTKDAQGKGLTTRSCKKLLTHGFENMGLHRIEIKVATDNLRSQAIPKKLNFRKEGLLRQAELVNNKFLDLYIYSMLGFEWAEQTMND